MEEKEIIEKEIPLEELEKATTPIKKIDYSYSRVDLYSQCKFKYKLKYIDKHYASFGNIATMFGSLMHATEESIANSIIEGKPIDYVGLKNNFIIELSKIKHKYPNEFYSIGKNGMTYYQKGYYYLEHGIYRLEKYMNEHPTCELVAAELDFNFDYDESHGFKGSIDRLIKDNSTNTYLVFDIKSYDEEMTNDKLTTPLQMVIYSEAVKRQFNVDYDHIKCIYDLPLCDTYHNAGTKGFIERGFEKINKLFRGIEDKDWKPTPSPLCHWCEFCPTNASTTDEFKYLCPYYSQWQSKGDRANDVKFEWQGIENHESVMQIYKVMLNKNKQENV